MKKGFTLSETLIFIALSSLLIFTVIVSVIAFNKYSYKKEIGNIALSLRQARELAIVSDDIVNVYLLKNEVNIKTKDRTINIKLKKGLTFAQDYSFYFTGNGAINAKNDNFTMILQKNKRKYAKIILAPIIGRTRVEFYD